MTQLRRKKILWKQQMLSSLEASHAALRDYYKETDEMRGHIYAVCTMLSPDSRFQFFLSNDWVDSKEFHDQYRAAFRDVLTPIQERLTSAKAHRVLLGIDINIITSKGSKTEASLQTGARPSHG